MRIKKIGPSAGRGMRVHKYCEEPFFALLVHGDWKEAMIAHNPLRRKESTSPSSGTLAQDRSSGYLNFWIAVPHLRGSGAYVQSSRDLAQLSDLFIYLGRGFTSDGLQTSESPPKLTDTRGPSTV